MKLITRLTNSTITKSSTLVSLVSILAVIGPIVIVSAGVYKYGVNSYELKNEGLYRLIIPGVENQQRIIFNDNTISLLSSIAWIYTHGNLDNKKDFSELETLAKSRQIIATCSNISKFVLNILESQNIEARVVSTLTLDEWNSFDNGHTMIEVYERKLNKFILFDLDNNAYFLQNDTPLSLIEFVNAVKSNDYEIKRIAKDPYMAVSGFKSKSSNFDYNFLMTQLVANDDLLKQWYERVIQVPFIHIDNSYYYYDKQDKDRIESYSDRYHFVEYKEFINRFYKIQ